MSSLRKILYCALLALPASSAFSAVTANPSLAVNITCNIDATVRIEWTNGSASVVAARTWTLANVNLNTVIPSTGNIANGTNSTNSLHITNRSQVPVDLAMGVSAQSGWTHVDITGHNAGNNNFTIRGSTAGGTPVISTMNADGTVNVAGPTFTYELPTYVLGSESVSFSNELARNANQALDLEFITPIDVTANSATMTVTVTGSVD